MENATKALLIAGSILIAILLIAIGVRIFNTTSETTTQSQSTMDATAINTFNSQFTGYLGKALNDSRARALIQKMISSNATSTHKVGYGGKYIEGSTTDPAKVNLTLIVGGTYTATYTDGYITAITKTETK